MLKSVNSIIMKNTILLFYSLVGLTLLACQPKESTTENDAATKVFEPFTIGTIEILDSVAFKRLNNASSIEVIADSFTWSEGPVWVSALNSVLFSDVPENKVWQWSEKDGLKLYLEPSGYTGEGYWSKEPGANGLKLHPINGSLVLCQHGNRHVALMDATLTEPQPKFINLAETYQNKAFNSPNDLVFDKTGNFFFTDPPYGLEKQTEDPKKELPFQGVYFVNTDGIVTLLTDTVSRPNGVALSPDEKILYVGNSDPNKAYILAYELNADKTIKKGGIFYDTTPTVKAGTDKGVPDGMTVSKDGTIYATGPGGVWVISPKGQVLAKIKTTQATSNCALDSAERYLYITADMYLMRVKLSEI